MQKLLGARLTSVQFVMDYLILGFDTSGALTTLVWPEILDNERHIGFGDVGYRDGLCELIERRVRSADISPDETISIGLDPAGLLRIPLRKYALSGERAIFTSPKNGLCVW